MMYFNDSECVFVYAIILVVSEYTYNFVAGAPWFKFVLILIL